MWSAIWLLCGGQHICWAYCSCTCIVHYVWYPYLCTVHWFVVLMFNAIDVLGMSWCIFLCPACVLVNVLPCCLVWIAFSHTSATLLQDKCTASIIFNYYVMHTFWLLAVLFILPYYYQLFLDFLFLFHFLFVVLHCLILLACIYN